MGVRPDKWGVIPINAMRKKTIVGPFWVMLVIGIIDALYNYAIYKHGVQSLRSNMAVSIKRMLLLYLWPTLLISESVLYWIVKRRIIYPKQAWVHVSCMLFCFIAYPLIIVFVVRYFNEFLSVNKRNGIAPTVYNILFYTYWASMVVGTAFFVMVLKKSFARPVVTPWDPDPVNLLDDVLN